MSVMTAGDTLDGGKSTISRLADSALKNFKMLQPGTVKH